MDKSNHKPEEKNLNSAEYRARLLTKLNCLSAVLEVAIAKISRSMELPGANSDRLQKIRSNLENTLSICGRAKQTLEKGPPSSSEYPPVVSRGGPQKGKMTYRDYVEFSSIDEYKKFKSMEPISKSEIASADWTHLAERLLDDVGDV